MFKVTLLGLSTISHAAIASAHICDCLEGAPVVHSRSLGAAMGYAVVFSVSLVLFIRHFVTASKSGDGTDEFGEA